jgi:hypothetical protein
MKSILTVALFMTLTGVVQAGPIDQIRLTASEITARAVDWLGDRYLLAKPINARPGRGTRAPARTSGQKAA